MSEIAVADAPVRQFIPQLLHGLKLSGYEDANVRKILEAQHVMERCGQLSMGPLLPLLLNLKGKPYMLKRLEGDNARFSPGYFPFETFYRTRIAGKTLFQTGRQVSKTLRIAGPQKVYLANGRRVAGETLKVGDHVLSLDEYSRRTAVSTVTALFSAPAKPVLRITTRTGVVLELAETHPLLKFHGWTPAAQLAVGDRICVAAQGGQFGRGETSRDQIIMTAYLIGDGCVGRRGNFSMTSGCPEVIAECEDISKRHGDFRQWVNADGLWGKYAWEKSLPTWVFDLSKTDSRLFISRLWAADGMIKLNKRTPAISYSTTSRELAFDVKSLLLKFGIPTCIKQRKAGYKSKKTGKYKRCRDCYIVRVETYAGWQKFLATFNVPGKPKVALPKTYRNNNRYTMPREVAAVIGELAAFLPRRVAARGSTLYATGLRLKPKYPLTPAKLQEYLDHFRPFCGKQPAFHRLETLLNSDVGWDTIVKIELLGKYPCWDIEVADTHNYIVDGVISHNSSNLAARGILHSVCTPFFTTLYVTPLFEMIRRFSQNYVGPFVEQSPVRKLFVGKNTTGSVLQRTFANNSKMIFSFAFLSADRTRGISSSKITVDECACGTTTYVKTQRGRQQLKRINSGDFVESFQSDGTIVWRKVLNRAYHGYRRCWRLVFDNGRTLDMTAESWLLTNRGWQRVSSIISAVAIAKSATSTDLGNTSRGRLSEFRHSKPALRLQPRLDSARLQHGQSPSIVVVRATTTRENEERRLWQMAESLPDTFVSGIRILQPALLHPSGGLLRNRKTKTAQRRQPEMAGRDRRSRVLGNDSLVDRGRRLCGKKEPEDYLTYRRFSSARSSLAELLAEKAWLDEQNSEDQSSEIEENLSCDSVDDGGDYKTAFACFPLDTFVHELQSYAIAEMREGGLCVLRQDVQVAQDTDKRSSDRSPTTGEMSKLQVAGELVGIKYLGYRHVYDLDVEDTHTFVANDIASHNCQDLDRSYLPIIRECMSGSPYGDIEEYAGTPKSRENCIAGLWADSSQAEWLIICHHCGYENIPALTHDLEKMIGPLREDISFEKPAVICAKCRKPILPHLGRWVHAKPEKRWSFAGYHVPQIIMPMHYASREKWSTLLGKQAGMGNTPINVFYNEVCGESYDTGSRIITLTDLQRACILPWGRDLSDAKKHFKAGNYIARVLACDWGGGGEEELSFTVYSVLGMLADGKIDCIFAYRSLTPHDHLREAQLAIGLANEFSCQTIAHDYTGAGSLRETFIIQAGYPIDRVLPIAYVRVGATSRIMNFKPGTKASPRSHYIVDKTRSLLLTCNQIKMQWLRFFRDDYVNNDDPGVLRDFLALVDEKVDSRLGKDIYTIIRDPNMRDDFAQATNVGCCALWHMTDKWPNIAAIAAMRVPSELLNAMHPATKNAMQDLL